MGARWYDAEIGHFISADTIIPEPGNALAIDRFAYAYNNPLKYTDPSGNWPRNPMIDGLGGTPEGAKCNFRGCWESGVPLDIVSRSSWGAYEPGSYGLQDGGIHSEGLYDSDTNRSGYKTYPGDLTETLDTIIIHHEGDDETYDVLGVQRKEMDSGFYDIGYHFIVGPDGTIYEGRDIGVRGNHAYPNSGRIGILWLGDFNPGYDISDPRYGQTDPNDDKSGPTVAQFQATVDLIVDLDSQYGIDNIYGHREAPHTNPTACPGDYAMPFVEILKQIIQ
jgi:hypothetical protein